MNVFGPTRGEPCDVLGCPVVRFAGTEVSLAHGDVIAAVTYRILRQQTAHLVLVGPGERFGLRVEHRSSKPSSIPMEDPHVLAICALRRRDALNDHLSSLPDPCVAANAIRSRSDSLAGSVSGGGAVVAR